MSLKFPISLVGKRASSGGDVPFATSLYDSGENLLVSIETDIPNNWNDNNTPYNATRLEIGTSCTSIGSDAFSVCNTLTGDLVIPNSVTTIGDFAFNNCTGLTGDLVIPNSVTTIGNFAFYNCYGLTGLTIGNSVTTIESSAFLYCTALTGDLVIPNSVTNIGSYAFSSNNFTGLVIPNSATSIGSYAFYFCGSLTTAYLAPPLANVGSQAFYYSGLTTVYAKDAVANGWTLGAGQTVGGKSGVTVIDWTNYPVTP